MRTETIGVLYEDMSGISRNISIVKRLLFVKLTFLPPRIKSGYNEL